MDPADRFSLHSVAVRRSAGFGGGSGQLLPGQGELLPTRSAPDVFSLASSSRSFVELLLCGRWFRTPHNWVAQQLFRPLSRQ